MTLSEFKKGLRALRGPTALELKETESDYLIRGFEGPGGMRTELLVTISKDNENKADIHSKFAIPDDIFNVILEFVRTELEDRLDGD